MEFRQYPTIVHAIIEFGKQSPPNSESRRLSSRSSPSCCKEFRHVLTVVDAAVQFNGQSPTIPRPTVHPTGHPADSGWNSEIFRRLSMQLRNFSDNHHPMQRPSVHPPPQLLHRIPPYSCACNCASLAIISPFRIQPSVQPAFPQLPHGIPLCSDSRRCNMHRFMNNHRSIPRPTVRPTGHRTVSGWDFIIFRQ